MIESPQDAVLEPYRIIWEVFPPEAAVPLIGLTVLISVIFMAKIWGDIEEDIESEPDSGYHPDRGYKFDLDELD